ncbi:rho GTPase-activating protein 29-like isoform X2 [Hoplias malabaricus]|uniref:rho GTPase-activating protein 29-like isoform X2 n=1 Tax=Hoplias malabaricus TaxID=27720 RepID=UPI003461A564
MFGQSGVSVSGGVGSGSVLWDSGRGPGGTVDDTTLCADRPDYILQLVSDVRNFANILLSLKQAFHRQDWVETLVEDRLAELLRVLKAVISKHQPLNSVEILSTAGTLVTKVKGVNFKEVNRENRSAVVREINSSIDTLAFTFGNVVSDFLMEDVEGGSSEGPHRGSRLFENLSVESGGYREEKDARPELSSIQKVDQALLKNDSGVESALLYAKAWSKYTKDVLTWVEKRLSVDMECAKSFTKMAESAKAVASQQDYMPFRDVYVSAFKNEIEYSQVLLQTAVALQTNRFIQPLMSRKTELDKKRKELKEQWQREQKKMSEAESAVRKARLLHSQRREEYEKARNSTHRSGEEQQNAGGRAMEKKRRLEEEALQKAEESQEYYKACVADAEVKRTDLENVKSEILTHIRELIFQCDLTLKAVTVNWFQMLQAQCVLMPGKLQVLCDEVKLYEPGQCYSEFVHSLPKEKVWLEALSQDNTGPSRTGISFHKRSLSSTHSHASGSISHGDRLGSEEISFPHRRVGKIGEKRSNSTADIQGVKSQCPPQAWSSSVSIGRGEGPAVSDSESAGGSSETRSVDSPTASPGDFKRRLPRTPSTGTMSSADDLDEREPPSPSDNGVGEIVLEVANSPGPFRNALMSKAAQTHKLRKLRAPSKCRECDSLVVFHGAECEECSLACHKKCLETLAIQCGHKKLQGRLHLFGIDFSQAARNSGDGIPFIIRKCTSEIENRALSIKGIYRVNGAKSRVEKLCQAFENGKDLVELSDLYPHDISNVLKLYLRQLPEPLILYRYYNDFIGLAKEAQSILVDEAESARTLPLGEEPNLNIELNRIIFKIRDLLRQLPQDNYKTLHFLITHLHRVMECAEENKMTASNLGIIFGPTLIKPRQSEAEVSLSSLVDYPYQALMVELFINHHTMIFDLPPSSISHVPPPHDSLVTQARNTDRLGRHSTSLLDIKESSKSYKRYSSIFPSTHLLDEAKEVKARDEQQEGTSSTAGECTEGVNYVAETQRSTLVFGRPNVQLRPHRSRLVSRPISMPVDRLLSERNRHNSIEQENNPAAIQEQTEPERMEKTEKLEKSDNTEKEKSEKTEKSEKSDGRYKSPFIHTHTLRRTWDKQYRHYDVTPRTAMIMANLPPAAATDKGKVSAGSEPASVFSSTTIRPFRASWKDNSQTGEGPISFRAPRTLQPPPGTFYKPPSTSRAEKSPPYSFSASVTTTTVVTRSSDAELRSVTASSPSLASVNITTALSKPELRTASVTSSLTTPKVVTMVSMTMGAPVATLTVSTLTASTIATPTYTTVTSSSSLHKAEDSQSESGSDLVSVSSLSPPLSPSSIPDDLSSPDARPVHQKRSSSRHIIPNKHREAHFV